MAKKEKGVIGRPKKFEGETQKTVEKGIRAGLTYQEACYTAGITYETLRNYFIANPWERERYEIMARATNLGAKEVIAELIRKKDAYTARWYLEKTDPAFSQKIQSMNINVNVAEELTEEQKQAIASRFVSNHGTDGRGNTA